MVRFIQARYLLNMNGMVFNMNIGIKIKGNRDLQERIRRKGFNYSRKGRKIITAIANDLKTNLKREMMPHSVLGESYDSIDVVPGKHSINKNVQFSEVLWFLEKGTRPHAIPDERAMLYGNAYGISPDRFSYSIYKKGTKAYPVITNAMNKTQANISNIIRNELRKK